MQGELAGENMSKYRVGVTGPAEKERIPASGKGYRNLHWVLQHAELPDLPAVYPSGQKTTPRIKRGHSGNRNVLMQGMRYDIMS